MELAQVEVVRGSEGLAAQRIVAGHGGRRLLLVVQHEAGCVGIQVPPAVVVAAVVVGVLEVVAVHAVVVIVVVVVRDSVLFAGSFVPAHHFVSVHFRHHHLREGYDFCVEFLPLFLRSGAHLRKIRLENGGHLFTGEENTRIH